MQLTPITRRKDRIKVLFELLKERTPEESISHKEMPTFKKHEEFVNSYPYLVWYFIEERGVIGTCYLTRQREIGIHIGKKHQGKGYGKLALQMLMEKHPGKFLANINPDNKRSVELFKKFGFELIQQTYASSC